MSKKNRIDEHGIEWVCSECYRSDVSQSAWANVNYPYALIDFVDDSTFWCEDCNEECNIEEYEEEKHGKFQKDTA